MLIISLGHKYTSTEIKKLKSREKERQAETNRILKPKNTIPELYHYLLILAKSLPPKVAKLKEPYRSDFGSQINHAVSQLFISYINLVNNNISPHTAQESFLYHINQLNALLIILNENKLLDYSLVINIGHTLTDLHSAIERYFKNANNS